jgi:putative transposase
MADARRFVWNWGLERKVAHYRVTGRNLSRAELSRQLTQLKHRHAYLWLQGIDSQLLQQGLDDLNLAFRAFFAGRARFPRFKRKRTTKATFRIPQRVRLEDGRVRVPKVGWIRARVSRTLPGPSGAARFVRDGRGRWLVSFVVACPVEKHVPSDPLRVVGVDVGIRSLVTTSAGEEFGNPRRHRAHQRRLAREHRSLSRKEARGRNRAKQRLRLARLYRRIAAQRLDYVHKMTTYLVRGHDVVCLENLNVTGLARTKLAKDVHDASFREIRRQLTYKADWRGRICVAVDRFYPSSRLCGRCGQRNKELLPSERVWQCQCGAVHDRDLNAAKNIRDEGIRLLGAAGGHSDAENACGADVRLPKAAVGHEAGIRSGSECQE